MCKAGIGIQVAKIITEFGGVDQLIVLELAIECTWQREWIGIRTYCRRNKRETTEHEDRVDQRTWHVSSPNRSQDCGAKRVVHRRLRIAAILAFI